jgi:collagenase-like PrtC family protease
MSRGAHRPKKICLACGETILSTQYTDSIATWAKRKFCCQTCRFDYNANRKPTKMPAHSPLADDPNVLATYELLKRLIRYGLRNDGLPGLPANDLLRLAREHGIAA